MLDMQIPVLEKWQTRFHPETVNSFYYLTDPVMSLPNRRDRYESDKCLTGNSEKPDSQQNIVGNVIENMHNS